jgi:hypothetical protein
MDNHLAQLGRLSGRHASQAERVRSPRADECDPLPGGPGAPVDRQKDRSARSALNRRLEGRGQNTREPETSGNPVLGLSHRGSSRWRVPRRGAGRRAHLIRMRSRAVGADIGRTMRLSALRLPFVAGGEFCFWNGVLVVGMTRTHRRRENDLFCPPPRSGGGGPPEGWWRGHAECRLAQRKSSTPRPFHRPAAQGGPPSPLRGAG